MIRIALFAAEGCEEIEALTVVDLLRRAGMETDIISLTENKAVTGSHNIVFGTEKRFEEVNMEDYDAVVLPGGMPGTNNLATHTGVCSTVKSFAESGKLVAAICAAPSVLGALGILEGKKATCYPGFEKNLNCASARTDRVVADGNVITSRGMGTAIDFGLAIVEYYSDKTVADDLAASIMYR
ncbi:MAG: DJ-1/PfpI family protein [Lachnospiraceae bacterium]|nr:DJ-1/PfpI family protein [Lachnospiraceae bacterium]